MRGVSVWASQQCMVKPDAIKRPLRRCGGCARKVAGLIRGGLRGCSGMPVQLDRRVARNGGGREVVARRGEVSRGRITGGVVVRREGPNVKQSARMFVLVAVAMTAAAPFRGLGGRVGG